MGAGTLHVAWCAHTKCSWVRTQVLCAVGCASAPSRDGDVCGAGCVRGSCSMRASFQATVCVHIKSTQALDPRESPISTPQIERHTCERKILDITCSIPLELQLEVHQCLLVCSADTGGPARTQVLCAVGCTSAPSRDGDVCGAGCVRGSCSVRASFYAIVYAYQIHPSSIPKRISCISS